MNEGSWGSIVVSLIFCVSKQYGVHIVVSDGDNKASRLQRVQLQLIVKVRDVDTFVVCRPDPEANISMKAHASLEHISNLDF